MDYGGSVGTHPLMYNEVVLDLPKTGALAVDVLNGTSHKADQREEGDRRVTRFVWDSPVVLPEEPLMPKASEIFPTLVVSSFASWEDFRAWYAGAVAGFTEPDEQIKKLAKDLTKGKKTEDERIRALFEFVADDIRYVNYVSGEWWLANRPQEVLARRQGDCDDKGKIHTFKRGVSVFSEKTKTPILLLFLDGNTKLMPKGRPWARPGKLTIYVGPVIPPSPIDQVYKAYKDSVITINPDAFADDQTVNFDA